MWSLGCCVQGPSLVPSLCCCAIAFAGRTGSFFGRSKMARSALVVDTDVAPAPALLPAQAEEAAAVDDDAPAPSMDNMDLDPAAMAARANTRFDDVWRQLWEQVRPLRRGADVVMHLGGQIDPTAALSQVDVADVVAREQSSSGMRMCMVILRRVFFG